ncbi:MAG: flagellin [Terracidiphilus sp.]|jgi:flagellar hook-associated protein 3 FlgL
MRIDPNLVPTILADLQQSQVSLNTALQEVSTGKSVNVPSDNPSAAADMVQNTIETGDVDKYTQNVNSVLSTVQSASSILNSVVTSLTQAVSLGTEGANGTNSTGNLQTLATQVQGILSTVVSAANTSVGGAYLFGGTSTATPYTADSTSPTGYTYNGNNDTNSVAVGDNLSVQANVPGSQIFSNTSNSVLGSLSSLVTALQSGNSSEVETATSAVDSALNFVGQQQAVYGNAETQLNSQETVLQQDTVTLSTQENNLIGVNEATAATDLTQAETDNSAALAATAKVLPNSLLNYLEPPS